MAGKCQKRDQPGQTLDKGHRQLRHGQGRRRCRFGIILQPVTRQTRQQPQPGRRRGQRRPAPAIPKRPVSENSDGQVDFQDRRIWTHDHAKTWIGDADLDGEFNSGDLVSVFASGKFETNEMAGWAEGDWDGDMMFGSGDLVVAFADGGYEVGPQVAQAVPEPSTLTLLAMAGLWLVGRGRRRA